MYAWSPEHLTILDSGAPIFSQNVPNEFDGFKARVQERFVPLFRVQEAVLYDGTVVIA